MGHWLARGARLVGRVVRLVLLAWRASPSLTMIGLALFPLGAPLLYEFFHCLDHNSRTRLGMGTLAIVIGAVFVRSLRVRPDREHPSTESPQAGRWWGWVPFLIWVPLGASLLAGPDHLGSGDWDFSLEKHEAMRRTILEWGQFPWWDPWSRGGFPLAGIPHFGALGFGSPMVLFFGTSLGLRLAALLSLAIATEGSRRLALVWLKDPVGSLAAGLIYGINGAVLVQVTAGFHLPMSYCTFPWMLLCLTQLERRPTQGIGLGVWLAFNVLNGILYYSVYAVAILTVAWTWRAATLREVVLRRFLSHTALAIGVLLSLAGWRIATTGLVFRDFPRRLNSPWAEPPRAVLSHLLVRPTAEMVRDETGIHFWDATCYVGPVVLLLAFASLNRGWRWWHSLAAICGNLAVGNLGWWCHGSYWLANFPVFSTMHMVGRWRIIAILGLGLAAADELASWRRSPSKVRRGLAVVLVGVIAVDYASLGRELFPIPFQIAPEPSEFPGPPTRSIVQVAEGRAFPAVLRGYGMIVMPEPMLGYDQHAPTLRTGRGGPRYSGEAWTKDGPIEPKSWSPNRIEFTVRPNEVVTINQNPGSWWLVNGRREFANWRCAETLREFQVQADSKGRLVLEIRPKGLGIGLALHLIGLALVVVTLIVSTRGRSTKNGPHL